MKAISLWQPWASLWLSPAKVYETRKWSTDHRGWLLVHAARYTIDDYQGNDDLDEVCERVLGRGWSARLPRGALIGAVKIIDCLRTEDVLSGDGYQGADEDICGDFSPGRYAWKRDDHFVIFDHPIPYRGMRGLFRVPGIADFIVAAGDSK